MIQRRADVRRGIRLGGGGYRAATSKRCCTSLSDIGAILNEHGFRRVQGSLYLTDNEDMANLFLAVQALRSQSWFPKSVRDIRAFRIEQWSDFTPVVKLA